MKLILALVLAALSGCGLRHVNSPAELAEYTRCEPARVGYWVDNSIWYEKVAQWEDAEDCMARRRGDCKCAAQVSAATLDRCPGYEPRIISLKNGDKRHAVVIFTSADGSKGAINWGKVDIYPKDTKWSYIVEQIPGGPWSVK